MIPFAANAAATAAAKTANAFEWPGQPQNCPFSWNFVTLPEEDRATALSNMHRKIGKDRACVSGEDMLADRQTNRHIDTHTQRERERERERDVLITIVHHGCHLCVVRNNRIICTLAININSLHTVQHRWAKFDLHPP